MKIAFEKRDADILVALDKDNSFLLEYPLHTVFSLDLDKTRGIESIKSTEPPERVFMLDG